MTRSQLSKILKSKVPLSKAMGISVAKCSANEGVEFRLPLKPNRNHKNTAFGGTLVAAQALASWAWMMCLLEQRKISAEVVVQRQTNEFLRPVTKNFRVKTRLPSAVKIERFLKTLLRRNKARLVVEAWVEGPYKSCVYVGEYVAIKNE